MTTPLNRSLRQPITMERKERFDGIFEWKDMAFSRHELLGFEDEIISVTQALEGSHF